MDEEKERKQLTAWFVSRPLLSGFLVFLILQSVVAYVVFQRYRVIEENNRREMSNILHAVHENVEQILKNASTASLTLALTINDEGKPENFDAIGKQLVESNQGVDAVQLVPNGIIKHVYPLKGNESVINFDILNFPATRKEALKSLANKKMYFAGPLDLKQGGQGIVGRLPVFLNNRFWGFSGVVIRLDTLCKISGLASMDDSKYHFQFSHNNPSTGKEQFYLPGKADITDKYYDYITFPDTDWKLYIISKGSLFYQVLPLAAVGSLMAVLFGLLIIQLLRKPAELQLQVLKQTRKLLNSEVKYRAIFEQAAVGIAHVDSQNGKIIDVNEQYGRMLGYTRNEIKGLNIHEITHPDDIDAGKHLIAQLKSGEIDQFAIEKRYFKKSGDTVWANVTVSPLWKPGEKPTAQIAIAEDITLKKKIKETMRKSEARFKSLFEDSPVALWEEDFSEVKKYLDGFAPELNASNAEAWLKSHPDVVRNCMPLVKIIDINNECVRLHRPKTREELLSQSLEMLLDNVSLGSFFPQLVAVVTRSKFASMETQIANTIDGDRDIHLRWSVMRGYEETLERVIISTEDITDQKKSRAHYCELTTTHRIADQYDRWHCLGMRLQYI
jgi:PAS domain S-box-containing protein